jgi:hypothetical protein
MNSSIENREVPRSTTSIRVVPWLFLLSLALAIRFYRLGHFSYWLDEVLDTYTFRSSWSDLWHSLRWQALQAPLDYMIRKEVELLSPGEVARRVPSIVWGIGCVTTFGWLLARRGGRWIGLTCAAALALAPYHVRYSQEVRPYSLGLFLLTTSLLALDRCLDDANTWRLAVLYFSCLATLYTLYLAAMVLFVAAASLVLCDCFDPEARRQVAARRFLTWSPVFLASLAAGLFPWWPVLIRAIGLEPQSGPPPELGPSRVVRWFAYFGFRGWDAVQLGPPEILFAFLVLCGTAIAWHRPRLRFLLAWAAIGLVAIEGLERRHPQYDAIFHWLPAGLGLTALAGVGMATLFQPRVLRPVGVAVLAASLVLDARGLRSYFREGRPDWRPVAKFLSTRPKTETVFTENPYTLFCVAFYLCGPDWPPCKSPGRHEVLDVHGDLPTLEQAWRRDTDAWLLLAAGPRSEGLRAWSRDLPSMRFPTAEGEGGILRRLSAERGTK